MDSHPFAHLTRESPIVLTTPWDDLVTWFRSSAAGWGPRSPSRESEKSLKKVTDFFTWAVKKGQNPDENVACILRDEILSHEIRIPSLTNKDFMVHASQGFWTLAHLEFEGANPIFPEMPKETEVETSWTQAKLYYWSGLLDDQPHVQHMIRNIMNTPDIPYITLWTILCTCDGEYLTFLLHTAWIFLLSM